MTIAQASKQTNISLDTLRYYERIGLIPPIRRTQSGIRDYSEEDLRWVEFVKCMRRAGLSIEVLTEYLRLFREGDRTLQKRRELLLEQRDQLEEKIAEMQETLGRLDKKIARYDDLFVCVKPHEKNDDKGYFEA